MKHAFGPRTPEWIEISNAVYPGTAVGDPGNKTSKSSHCAADKATNIPSRTPARFNPVMEGPAFANGLRAPFWRTEPAEAPSRSPGARYGVDGRSMSKKFRHPFSCFCRPSLFWRPWSQLPLLLSLYSSFTPFRLTRPRAALRLRRPAQLRPHPDRSGLSRGVRSHRGAADDRAPAWKYCSALGWRFSSTGQPWASACCALAHDVSGRSFSPVLVSFQFHVHVQ